MPLPPEELTAHSIRRRWRGYDRTQVDQLLTRAHSSYAGALERLADTADDLARARAERAELRSQLDALAAPAPPADEPIQEPGDLAGNTPIGAVSVAEPGLKQAATSRPDTTRPAGTHGNSIANVPAPPPDYGDDRRNGTHADPEAEPRFGLNRDDERRIAGQIRRLETELGGLRSQVVLLDQIQHMEQALAALRDDVVASSSSHPRHPPPADEPR